jgi:acyl-CoA synthetase (AMP-forming)/AMP-acid ligase II
VRFQRRKRRKAVAHLLEALLAKHPTGTIYVAWDNASTHEDDEVEAVVRAAAGRSGRSRGRAHGDRDVILMTDRQGRRSVGRLG